MYNVDSHHIDLGIVIY